MTMLGDMDFYSVALSLALLAVGVSMLAALLEWVAARKGNADGGAMRRRVARLGAMLTTDADSARPR